ncbi:hypothetical protein SAMN05661044_00407 [Olivibacter domesticus]|uniref:Uncharacterized protein n=1 Tax=Olivibacter domesticus TaxID=407022 RepID=A0A1H7HKI1_OLID1|nr:hypothetical protein SAMN05661044_00407 [Olivibacter domesticus]
MGHWNAVHNVMLISFSVLIPQSLRDALSTFFSFKLDNTSIGKKIMFAIFCVFYLN